MSEILYESCWKCKQNKKITSRQLAGIYNADICNDCVQLWDSFYFKNLREQNKQIARIEFEIKLNPSMELFDKAQILYTTLQDIIYTWLQENN